MYKIYTVKIQVSVKFSLIKTLIFLDKIDLINNLNQIKLL